VPEARSLLFIQLTAANVQAWLVDMAFVSLLCQGYRFIVLVLFCCAESFPKGPLTRRLQNTVVNFLVGGGMDFG
jgi:hypothetical protein